MERVSEKFLTDAKLRTGTGNDTNLESLWRVWLLPAIGKKKMSRLTEQHFQDVLNAAHADKKAKKTISNIRGAVTAFLRYARKAQATTLHTNDLVIPNEAAVGERRILSANEIKKLFSSDQTTHYGKPVEEWYINAFRLLVIVGLRPGELCDLRRVKQASKSTLTVSGSYNRFGENTKGKTHNAVRRFVLPSYGVKIMNDQRKLLVKFGIASKYLFPTIDGEQSTSAQIYKRWTRHTRANGITDVSLYELRHTFVSMCKGSIPEALIKPVVGHSSKMPTYNTYGHALDGELETVAQMIEAAYSEIINDSRG